jgi:hypothetical protein
MRKAGAESGVVGAAGGRSVGATRQCIRLLLAWTTALGVFHFQSAQQTRERLKLRIEGGICDAVEDPPVAVPDIRPSHSIGGYRPAGDIPIEKLID